MKKFILLTIAFCVVLFISCKKDSTSNGNSSSLEKRINKIYWGSCWISELSTDNGETWTELYSGQDPEYLLTSYEWDGDKLLSIKNTPSYDSPSQWDYSYNSMGLISRITTHYDNQTGYMNFTYSDSKLTQIDYHCYDELYETCKIMYSNDNPHEIWYYYHDGTVYYNVLLWENDNVTHIFRKNASGALTGQTTFIYDDKINPYYDNNAFFVRTIMSEEYYKLSKNNNLVESWGDTLIYDYNFDYPIKKEHTSVAIYPPMGNDPIIRETYTYYYNYKYLEYWQ